MRLATIPRVQAVPILDTVQLLCDETLKRLLYRRVGSLACLCRMTFIFRLALESSRDFRSERSNKMKPNLIVNRTSTGSIQLKSTTSPPALLSSASTKDKSLNNLTRRRHLVSLVQLRFLQFTSGPKRSPSIRNGIQSIPAGLTGRDFSTRLSIRSCARHTHLDRYIFVITSIVLAARTNFVLTRKALYVACRRSPDGLTILHSQLVESNDSDGQIEEVVFR